MSVTAQAFLLFLFSCCKYEADCSTTLDRSETRCLEDDAIFHCSSIQGGTTVMSWQVTSTCGSRNYRTSFSSTSTVGQTRDVTLCSTTLMFTVTSLTSSSISVTLTIHTPVLLNGTRVTCEDQSQTMKLIPYDINPLGCIEIFPLSSTSYDILFEIEWESIQFSFIADVTIQPPPLCGPTNKTNSSVVALLEGDGNIFFNVCILQRACSQEITTLFSLECPLKLNLPVKKFMVFINGTMTALSKDSEIITCTNKSWPIAKQTYDLGNSTHPTKTSCGNESEACPTKTSGGNESEENNNDSPSNCNCGNLSNSKELQYFMTGIVIGASVLSVIATLITTAVVYKICEICKRKVEALNITKTNRGDTSSQLAIEPIYDDIELTNKNNTIDISNNIAYVDTKMSSY